MTKAVHLELVSNLTTEAFLASFKRFVSWRGLPTDVFSDNGSNFMGAANELKDVYYSLSQAKSRSQIQAFCRIYKLLGISILNVRHTLEDCGKQL